MRRVKFLLKIIICLAIISIAAYSIYSLNNTKCNSIRIEVTSDNKLPVITENYLKRILKENDIPTVGMSVKKISLEKVASLLKQSPFIKSIDKLGFTGSTLVIAITLKTLIAHIFPIKGEQYYLDSEGELLPFSNLIKENLIVVNGNIYKQYDKNIEYDCAGSSLILKRVFNVCKAIINNNFANSQLRQIYINANIDMELVASVGNQIILIGDDSEIEQKLFNIEQMYKNVIINKGINFYTFLDVRFRNRIYAIQ